MKRIRRSAIVEHRAAELYALVEDIEAYPKFLPWCLSASVRERGAGRTLATLRVGVKGIDTSFSTENRNVAGEAISMRLVDGPFKRFAADWRFRALSEKAAKIEFSMEYEFSNRVTGKALEPLFEHIADTMVEAFMRRAEAVYGKAAD